MKRYLLEFSIPLSKEGKYTAAGARGDVIRTFISEGVNFVDWHPWINLSIPKLRGFLFVLCNVMQVLCFSFYVQKGDKVYIQYTYLAKCLPFVIWLMKLKGVNVTLLIHDLDFIRYKEQVKHKNSQIRLFNKVDTLFVHTKNMKDCLMQLGVKTEMKPMILFDYYTTDPYKPIDIQESRKNIIAFAGNLNKSVFLRKLDQSFIPVNFEYKFYGVEPKDKFTNKQIVYGGKFKPEHPAKIEAGWGLVWDGDSIDTCSGRLGQYLHIISPHKLSLYIASGIPVIVWSNCAHAQFVKDRNIGIVVNSINDIYEIIDNVSLTQYEEMIENTRKIGNHLRNGDFLRQLINQRECS